MHKMALTPQGATSLRGGLLLGAVALAAACSHQTQISHGVMPLRRAPTAMERQIINAVDAGEGDPQVRELRRRLSANPYDIQARLDLAARYKDQGFPELALDHYRFAAARAPHLSGVSMLLARALFEAGEERAAISELINFCKLDPSPPVELLSLLGIYEDTMELFSDAERHHAAAVHTDPRRPLLRNNLGYNLFLQGKMAPAEKEFRAALALNPHLEIARNNLGTVLALRGETQEALLHWQSASGPATAHSNLASIWIEQKRYAEARKEIDVALSYSRNHVEALANLALLADLDGEVARIKVQERVTLRQRLALTLRKALIGDKMGSHNVGEQIPAQAAAK